MSITESEIFDNLCDYDQRSWFFKNVIAVNNDPENYPIPRDNCFCDNCFNGRDKLALEIIRLREWLIKIMKTSEIQDVIFDHVKQRRENDQ